MATTSPMANTSPITDRPHVDAEGRPKTAAIGMDPPVAYITTTLRNEETLELFMAHSRSSGLIMEDVTSWLREGRGIASATAVSSSTAAEANRDGWMTSEGPQADVWTRFLYRTALESSERVVLTRITMQRGLSSRHNTGATCAFRPEL